MVNIAPGATAGLGREPGLPPDCMRPKRRAPRCVELTPGVCALLASSITLRG